LLVTTVIQQYRQRFVLIAEFVMGQSDHGSDQENVNCSWVRWDPLPQWMRDIYERWMASIAILRCSL